ncbi:DUF402 domain-containing protein [Actinoplanes utahensis]|nr:DUF402 domain-containing protein [Actinoplanes utahensis]
MIPAPNRMTPAELVLRKYDGRPHRRVTGHLLGTDDFGTWIGTPRGSVVHYSYGWRRRQRTREHAVRLLPHHGWWMAMFLDRPNRLDVYCDVATPAERDVSPTGIPRFTVVDLDIDVLRFRSDGRVQIDDEDEFHQHREHFGYPADVVTAAGSAADALHQALAGPHDPFTGRHEIWMNRMLAGTGRHR